MPMVVLVPGGESVNPAAHAVGIVETDQPRSVRIVQGEGVAQSMGTLRRRLHAPDLEFEPIALFEMMHAAIERQQKFERVFVGNGAPSLQ